MRHLHRLTAAAAVTALAAAAFAGTATAATTTPTTPQRATFVVGLGEVFADTAATKAGGPRKLRSLKSALADLRRDWYDMGGGHLPLVLSGVADRNQDGIDDDGVVTLTLFANRAVVDLTKKTPVVRDGGFVLKDRRAVLKESALNLDTELRWVAASVGADTWDMEVIDILRADAAPGVRVVSDHDGNRDGLDDDGRLTLLKNGKAVTLTIGNTLKEKGKVTYGPTWATAAPKRTHHRADAALIRASEHAGAEASTAQFAKILQAESAMAQRSARDVRFLKAAIRTAKEDGVKVQVTGILDANKDGMDDDAKITVTLNQGKDVFVLTLPAEAGAAVTYKSVKG